MASVTPTLLSWEDISEPIRFQVKRASLPIATVAFFKPDRPRRLSRMAEKAGLIVVLVF
jgi:hypothetical protein